MKKLLSLLILSAFLFSCGEDDGGANIDFTAEETSEKILATGELAAADLVSMTESEGVQAMEDFANLFTDFDQFSSREEKQNWIKRRLQIISHYFVSEPTGRVNDDKFVFDDIKGIYDWNPELEDFERTGDSDAFVVNFPTEESATNNAQLSITDLQFVTITETDGDVTYEEEYPTSIVGSLKVNGETYISVNASANWSSEGIPEKGSIDLLVSPFMFAMAFDDTNDLRITGNTSLSKNDVVLMAADLAIDFETAAKEEPTKMAGFVQYSNLKVSGDIDVAGYNENAYDDNGEVVPGFDGSEYINLILLIDDEKVGDITFEEDIAYVIYLDGTKENLEELLEDVIADMESSLEQFEGEDENPG